MPRAIDLTGQRFGRLEVLYKTEHRDGSNIVYACKCDCGKDVNYSTRDLRSRNVKSCGCLRLENSKVNLNTIPTAEKLGHVYGTNLSRIVSKRPQANNTSGVRGVAPHPKGWIAYIYFQGKRYHLYTGAYKETAITRRREAEERVFGDFLAWYYEQYPKKGKHKSPEPTKR